MGNRIEDIYLVLRAQAGSQKAFDALYRAYTPAMLRFAYRHCGNTELAKEVVQDAWITIHKTLNALQNPQMFRARAFKAVRWRTQDHLRKHKITEPLNDEIIDKKSINAHPWATRSQILKLIDQLPVIERQAIYLFYLEDMSIRDLAVIFDVPSGTIKSRLNRARNSLKTIISGENNAND